MPGLRWILEPGHRADTASWTPSFVLTGLAMVPCALPYVMTLLLESPGYASSAFGLDQWWQLPGVTLASLLMTCSWVLRRHLPMLMTVVAVCGALLSLLVSPLPVLSAMMVPLVVYDVARWGQSHQRVALYAGLAGSLIGPLRWMLHDIRHSEATAGPWIVLMVACAGMVVASYVIARYVRASDERSAEIQAREAERLRHELAERDQRARMIEASTRTQIARELHDIVAHSLSVIVVQAEGGKALATKRPEQAGQVLGTIADTSREALAEMRRIVGVLRDDPRARGSADYLPAPGLADIAEMVRRSGDRFRFTEQGVRPAHESKALGLTAYRVVQEAVTNVLKHAGPDASAEVLVTYHPDALELSIRDDGAGADAGSDNRGHGLRGMHERVHAMGGMLHAAPVRGGREGRHGFAVHALLPYGKERMRT